MISESNVLSSGLRFTLITLFKYIIIIISVSLLLFFLLRIAPLDPTAMLISPSATAADISRLKHNLGLDQPLWRQYVIWLGQLMHGDMGQSIVSGEPIAAMLRSALPVTLALVFGTLFSSLALALLLALLAFHFKGRTLSYLIDALNNLFLCIPDFLWSVALIFIFGITLHLLPFFGLMDPNVQLGDHHLGLPALFNLASHFILPICALVMGITPLQVKNLFNQFNQIYQQDYIHYARVRGMQPLRLLLTQALPNALPSSVALIGNQASMLIGGTLLVETLFGLPGLGMLMIKGIGNQDLPLIQGVALCYTLSIIVIQLVSNILIHRLTPRLRVA